MKRFCVALAVLVLATSCSSGDDSSDDTTATEPEVELVALDEARSAELATMVGDGSCDPLDTSRCLLPFPSDHLLVDDESTETGQRVSLPEGQLPNGDGKTLDPTEWNRNDGFSPGTPILVDLGNVDLDASDLPRIGDIAASMEASSGSTLLDLDTGERVPHFAELDATAADGATSLLIIRPAIALTEGHRFGVGIAALDDKAGNAIEPSLGFEVFRDRLETDIDSIEQRREGMEELFGALEDAGETRSDLIAAWHFRVASADSLSTRMLTMRDQAFEMLGDQAPSFEVTEVVEDDVPEGIARSVRGSFDVPSFLEGDGAPGSRLEFDEAGLPTTDGDAFRANFTCQVPDVALEAGGRARPVVYGHGLLGSASESQNSQVAKIASSNNMVYCATDWIGLSAADIGNAVAILGDISQFPSLPDRSQQGILNSLFLARTMTHAEGFGADANFQTSAGESVIDGTEAYYDGNSQGGIIGGAATAVSQEWTKAVLGVPGMNYSTLLSRSVDFDTYFEILKGAYPDPADQQIIYGVLQMLWDRADANGYAQHMTTDPYENTPEHTVILDVAFGDHQVAPLTAEIEARTIGAKLRVPALANSRHGDEVPFYGLDEISDYPYDGSALIYHDSGTLAPPETNVTPELSEEYLSVCAPLAEDVRKKDDRCADSHENPRRSPATIQQKDTFFTPKGLIEDYCEGEPCTAEQRFNLDY